MEFNAFEDSSKTFPVPSCAILNAFKAVAEVSVKVFRAALEANLADFRATFKK